MSYKDHKLKEVLDIVTEANRIFDSTTDPISLAMVLNDTNDIFTLMIEVQKETFVALAMANAGVSPLPTTYREDVDLQKKIIDQVSDLRRKILLVIE